MNPSTPTGVCPTCKSPQPDKDKIGLRLVPRWKADPTQSRCPNDWHRTAAR